MSKSAAKPAAAEAATGSPVEMKRVRCARDFVDCSTEPPTLRRKGAEFDLAATIVPRYEREQLIEPSGESSPSDASVSPTQSRPA